MINSNCNVTLNSVSRQVLNIKKKVTWKNVSVSKSTFQFFPGTIELQFCSLQTKHTANVFVVNYTTFRSVPFPGQFLSYFLLLIVVYYKSSYSYSSTTKLSYFLLLIIVYYELSYFTLVRQDCRTFYYELSYSKLDYIFCTTNM